MDSPKPPAPDPATVAAQAAEQRRAEAGQITQTQMGLNADNVALRRRFGTMATGIGGAALAGYNGVMAGGGVSGGSGTGGFSLPAGFNLGGGFGLGLRGLSSLQ